MASGDSLKHRGVLTKQIVRGLAGLLADQPLTGLHEVVVDFFDNSQRIVKLRLLAALQSVTFDISEYEDWSWHSANHAYVRIAKDYDIKFL